MLSLIAKRPSLRKLPEPVRKGLVKELSTKTNFSSRARVQLLAVQWSLLLLFAPVAVLVNATTMSTRLVAIAAVIGFLFLDVVLLRRAIRSGTATLQAYVKERWVNGRAPVCYACQYDLRGSPGEHCPECGCKIPTLEMLDIDMPEQLSEVTSAD